MRSRPVIITEIRGEEPSQMPLAEDDHVIQTLAANGSDQALRVWILPGARWARQHLANAHPGDAAPERAPVDGVAIPQQPSRRRVVRKGVNHLLRRPGCRGMRRIQKSRSLV